jgi:hypothetical protein
MKPIETVLEFPRGAVLGGLIAGVFALVVPLAAWGAGAPPWLPAVVTGAVLARRLWLRSLPLWQLATCAPTMALSALVLWASVEPMDRRIKDPLPAAHIAIDELDRRIAWGDDDVSREVVELPSARPTWREVDAALKPHGYHLDAQFCRTCEWPNRVRIVPGG